MKKLSFLFFFLFFFGVVPNAWADTTSYQTPTIITTPNDINNPTATHSAFPITWTSATSEGVRVSGLVFNLPTHSIVDGFLIKFTMTANSSGWSWFPRYSKDGIAYVSYTGCGLTDTSLGVPCQYNTINGTTTNGIIGMPSSGTLGLTAADVGDPDTVYQWNQSTGTKTITLTSMQIAIVYHSSLESDFCGDIFILSDMCTVIAGLFLPDTDFAEVTFDSLNSTFLSKAPFGYIDALLNLDLSVTGSATTSPTLTLPIGHTNEYISELLPSDMSWSDSTAGNAVAQTTNSFRIIFTILLWLAFLFYLFFALRRIF